MAISFDGLITPNDSKGPKNLETPSVERVSGYFKVLLLLLRRIACYLIMDWHWVRLR